MADFLGRFDEQRGGEGDLLGALAELDEPPGAEPPCRPVDLDEVAAAAAAAFDPTGPDAPARLRVLGIIDGLDPDQPLAPPEVCVGLDRPVWRDLEAHFPDWLLPGRGALLEDSAIALETNATFNDALVVGYNTQLLSELRWRNQQLASRCTPLRVVWGRADTATGASIPDILSVGDWPRASGLGATSHRPPGAAGRDLVLVFRGRLFLRYPQTTLYLVSAMRDGAADFSQDPADGAARVLPGFQGRIGPDVTFFGFPGFPAGGIRDHWAVLEEPPSGNRFYNVGEATPPADADGVTFAWVAFADPVRVLIPGSMLVPGDGP
jgi:hypothetical protein